jgi:hypothetical protein
MTPNAGKASTVVHGFSGIRFRILCIISGMKNRSLPTDLVLLHVSYQDVTGACGWLATVFGFRETYRHGDPVSGVMMHLGLAYVMLHRTREGCLNPAQLGYGTQMLTIVVEEWMRITRDRLKRAPGSWRNCTRPFTESANTELKMSTGTSGCSRGMCGMRTLRSGERRSVSELSCQVLASSVVSHAKLYNMICSSYAVVHVVTQCSIGG